MRHKRVREMVQGPRGVFGVCGGAPGGEQFTAGAGTARRGGAEEGGVEGGEHCKVLGLGGGREGRVCGCCVLEAFAIDALRSWLVGWMLSESAATRFALVERW
jgi:hypothetical protein